MITAWPRLEIGKSSVTPWIKPKTMAWKYVITRSPLSGVARSAREFGLSDRLHVLGGHREIRDQREDRDPEHRAHGAVPEPSPPSDLGAPKRSANEAPSGRATMYANQN